MRWVGTSWKMTKTLAEAREYASGLARALREAPAEHGLVGSDSADAGAVAPAVQPFVIPSHTAIAAVAEELGDLANVSSGVMVGAQNAHWEDTGAWTGEVSASQVKDAGATMIEIGHSERREHFNETTETTGLKVRAALRHGLMPLLCVGESSEVRKAGGTVDHLLEQAAGALEGLSSEELSRVLIAYEPVWAIGENGRPATADELAEPLAALHRQWEGAAGLLYGGSVNQENAAELLTMEGVDGLFIGRAAWQVGGYLRILEMAAQLPAHHASGSSCGSLAGRPKEVK